MKTLEYPLLAITLTDEDCTVIIAPVLNADLPKMGTCRTMVRSIVYTPLKHRGVGIKKLYTTHGLVYVRTVIDHIWRQTESGNLFCTSMEHLKLEAGIIGVFV